MSPSSSVRGVVVAAGGGDVARGRFFSPFDCRRSSRCRLESTAPVTGEATSDGLTGNGSCTMGHLPWRGHPARVRGAGISPATWHGRLAHASRGLPALASRGHLARGSCRNTTFRLQSTFTWAGSPCDARARRPCHVGRPCYVSSGSFSFIASLNSAAACSWLTRPSVRSSTAATSLSVRSRS